MTQARRASRLLRVSWAAQRHLYTPGHVLDRTNSRHRLIELVGAAPSPPAHTPPGRRPPWFLLGSLRWSRGGCYSSLAVSLIPQLRRRPLPNRKSNNSNPNPKSSLSRSPPTVYLGKRLATKLPHTHVGETEGRSKIRDKNTLYKERAKRRRSGEATGEKGGKSCTKC